MQFSKSKVTNFKEISNSMKNRYKVTFSYFQWNRILHVTSEDKLDTSEKRKVFNVGKKNGIYFFHTTKTSIEK